MKVYSVLLIIVFSLTTKICPQVQFTPHTITTDAKAAQDVYAVDVDGDGDMDVLSASVFDDKIAWYENDGNENFVPHTITSTADGAWAVYTKDVDTDGDIDVLSASDYGVAWYENDGNENFTTHDINASANSSLSVYAADVDSDGDIDVLSANYLDDNITWYENDGNENFIAHAITNSVDMTTDVYAIDVDSDGDMDVLSGSCGEYPSFNSEINWYENDGSENFTQYTIIANASYFLSVHAEDLDRDGDIDVLSASSFDDKIAWYENDGNENFVPHTITTGADAAMSVYTSDVDGDGDIDVLSASYYDHKIAWYENDGNQNFTPHIITTNASGARSVFAIDVDGDGYMDVLSASRYDSTIAWYENSLLTDTLQVPGDYATIQEAIDAAMNGNVVLVDEGTYYENINFKGKAITVASHFLVDEDTSHITNTIIDGSNPTHPDSGTVVMFKSGEDTNSVLCGFTITGGTGTLAPSNPLLRAGGGIVLFQSGAKIKNNIIEYNIIDNIPWAYGGGILSDMSNNSDIIVKDNVIRNNACNGNDYACAGGIKISTYGYALISNNKIIGNSISASIIACGGGIKCWGPIGEIHIVSNYIKGNTVQTNYYGGGGINISECTTNTPIIENNIIVDNFSSKYGGGILIDLNLDNSFKPGLNPHQSVPKYGDDLSEQFLVNNTIYNNSAAVSGGGFYAANNMTANIMNCILWENTAPNNPQIGGDVNVVYSDVEGGFPGEHNIDVNPSFADTLFHLADSSLCIGAGIDSLDIGGTMHYCPPFCYYGGPRPNPPGSMPDIGACESPRANPISLVEGNISQLPNEYSLDQNYPNPFNPITTIKYGIPERKFVELRIYDILGREVELILNEEQDAGYYELNFDASQLSTGIYFYRLKTDSFVETKKMVLMK
jgi:hypothetical protein